MQQCIPSNLNAATLKGSNSNFRSATFKNRYLSDDTNSGVYNGCRAFGRINHSMLYTNKQLLKQIPKVGTAIPFLIKKQARELNFRACNNLNCSHTKASFSF